MLPTSDVASTRDLEIGLQWKASPLNAECYSVSDCDEMETGVPASRLAGSSRLQGSIRSVSS